MKQHSDMDFLLRFESVRQGVYHDYTWSGAPVCIDPSLSKQYWIREPSVDSSWFSL